MSLAIHEIEINIIIRYYPLLHIKELLSYLYYNQLGPRYQNRQFFGNVK